MKYDFFTKELDEISQIITLNKKILNNLSGQEVSLYKKSVHKNLSIAIYTFWENFAKNLIYNCYDNYKKILVDKKFLINFFQHIQEKPFARQLFLKSIDDNKINITIDNLCYSNNLNFKELKSLFKRVMFNADEFGKHVEEFPQFNEVIEELKINAVDPVFEKVKSRYEAIEYLEAYLNLLVENRNTVAHQYQITQIYTLDQFEAILKFIKIVTLIVFEFCGSQLLTKAKERGEIVYKRLLPLKVIKSNSSGQTAIIGIRNISQRAINKTVKLYCYDRSSCIYRILDIIKIVKQEGNECNDILPLETYSLEVQTSATINQRNSRFIVCELNPNSDSYDYQVIV
ncbi:HEPN domain-containing protein [Priestia megaterium]